MTETEDSKPTPKHDDLDTSDGRTPLVFISHDGRDADLAEAFSKLLKRVSAGALKSFRSSDRAGTEGISYGDDWYKQLMEKLDDATDVVCLFTKRSLNRPWILFEAGVAKGKLSTSVHGVALGISLSKISTGPFYQFQNCQDDEDSLTGLMMQLLKQIPNTDPDRDVVTQQVQVFKNEVADILAKGEGEDSEPLDETIKSSETSPAKLFEEIKIMLRDLPSSFDDRFPGGNNPFRDKRTIQYSPMMLHYMVKEISANETDLHMGLVFLSSLIRNDAPWLYELGMDVYRTSTDYHSPAAKAAMVRLRKGLMLSMRGPLAGEIMAKSKQTIMLVQELLEIQEKIMRRNMENEETEIDN